LDAVFVGSNGRRWDWTVEVDPEAPHGVHRLEMRRALPPGVEVRLARPEDGPGIRDVAVAAPVVLGESVLTIDPGPDPLGHARLMGPSAITYVATLDGRPIGTHCGISC